VLRPHDAWARRPGDCGACREPALERHLHAATEQDSVRYPGNAGGSNRGGVTVDPERQILVANVMNFASTVRLIAREIARFEVDRDELCPRRWVAGHVERGEERLAPADRPRTRP
jgi:glucose dehydrogenase